MDSHCHDDVISFISILNNFERIFLMACSGWICKHYITKITGAYGRWKLIIFMTHLFNARKASLSSKVMFFLRIWNSMVDNQTSYITYPTQIYIFQLNEWAR
jgi:hypothetical protein